MGWTANYTVSAGETSGGLIVGSNGIPDAVASNMIVFGTANDFIVSHGGILRASSGGVTNDAQIVGTAQAQEIIEHLGVANDTVVDNAAGYMWQRGSSYRAVVKKGHQSLVGANARSWDTIVDGGEQRVSAAGAIAYNTVIRTGVQSVYNGAFASNTVISGGKMQVYAGATVDGVTIMVGNGKNAVLRPEADGATFAGDICMDLTTAITVPTTANYFISSVSRVAASSGVTFSIKVKEYDQLAGEYCVGGGTTNITATVTTDTGKTLGTISRGTGNPAYSHFQYGAYRLYNNTYLYLSVVTGAAVYSNTTTVAQQAKVLEDVTVGNGQSAYVYAEGSALRMTLNDAPLRVWGEVTSTTVNGTGAVIVSSGGVAKNTLVNANSQYVYAGGSALDTVVRGGILQLHDVGAYANNVTVYGGDARLVLDVNGAQVDGNVNVDISQITADNTSGTTFINSLSRVLGYTPHGVTFTVTVAEEGQRAGNYFYAGNLNNFTATVVTDTGKTLGTINGVSTTGGSGAWLHTKYGSYRFYNDTYVMLGVVDGHPVELWNGNTLEASGDTLSDQSVTVGKTMFVYENGAATDNTVDGGALLVSEGGVATGNTVVSGSAVALSGGVMSGTIANGSMAFIRVSEGGIASDNQLVVSGARELIYSGGTAIKTSLTAAGAYQNVGDYMAGVDNTGTLALDTELAAGAFQNVYSGAVASRTTITGAGASQVINAAAAARDTVASTGVVRVAGQTTSTTLRGDAQELVSAATAVANGTVISGGAQKLLIAGAKAYDVVISAGSQLLNVANTEAYRTVVYGGMLDNTAGRTESTTIHGAGREMVRNGATTYYTVLESDVTTGNQFVRAGGVAYYTTVRAGAQQLYDATATAYDTVVSGGQQQVFAGASAIRTVLSNGKIQNGGGLVSGAELFGAAANRLYVSNGGVAIETVLHDLSIVDVTSGTVISTTLYDGTQELLRSGGVASGAIVSGGAQKVLSAGAVASDTIVYAGYQQVVAGASAWNTTIVAGNNGYVSLADGAVTGGTWNFDLSQGYQAGQMLNAWYITSGTDLVITVSADDQPLGKYLLSNNAGGYDNETFTVKDTAGNEYGSIHAGQTVDVGGVEYSLDIVGTGLYFVTGSYPVEIYTNGILTDYGETVSGAKIVAGMTVNVNDGGTLEDAAIVKAGGNKVLVSSGGKVTGAEIYGQGVVGTDIRVFGGGSASNTLVGDAAAMLRLYGGTAYDTVVGGQFLTYNGAFASNTTVIDGGVQKLLVSGAPGTVTASNTTVSSGGYIQVGATLEQIKGSYLAGGDIRTVNLLSGGTMFVEFGATAADVALHAGASAYVYSGATIAFTSIESDAKVNVRFSQATGNTEALITDWGTIEAGAKISVKEVGGAGSFKIADSVNAGFTVNYDEFDVFGGRDIAVGTNFSDAFRGLNFVLGTTGTLTVADLTIGTQATAATLRDSTATKLTDNSLATTWTSATDLSTIPVVANANTGADAWLTLDGTTVNGALYGAEGTFANDVNLKFRDGSITNLAAGAKAGGSVANVNVMVGEIDPDWTEVSHGTTFNGVAYAGGFGSVSGTAGTVINDGTFKKDFYAGALANKLDDATSVGEVSMRIFGGKFSGNIYGASAVKTVAGKDDLRHSVGDVTLTIAGGETTKGTQACIFAGGYATGTATGTVYTVDSVKLDISGGTWGSACGGRGVFGGIMASGVTAEAGDVEITVSDGTMGNVYGGGWAQKGGQSIVGNVNINIAGGEIANVFGGGSTSITQSSGNGSTVTGDVTITVSGGTITGAIYAKGQGVNDSTGSAEVVFKGASVYACGVYGYSYVETTDPSNATLSFSGYTGTFSGAIGGFAGVTFDGITAMTLTTAEADVINTAWNFDVADRSAKFADNAMLNWTAADFTGDTITLNLATGDTNEWSLVTAATDTVYNKFDVLVNGSVIAAELDIDDKISGGAYDGWGFTNDEGTLKFKQLA